ncbi:MAG: IS4 family transposase [Planctomycetaceae bacterium]|nr:IS4 family transposase [Planctomycetaceae bacterium]
MPTEHQNSFDAGWNANFDEVFSTLPELINFPEFDGLYPAADNAVYTTSVVLWMLTYQRLSPDSTLEAAVKRLAQDNPVLLPKNKRVSDATLSKNTSGYSRARSRLPEDATTQFVARVSQSIIEASPPSHHGRRLFLIDSTTITLAPEEELQERYPPATNQYGEGVWPVAQLVVAHEIARGAAMNPSQGAMYGEKAVSETALIGECLEQLPQGSIVMADAGYGIFSVAHQIHERGLEFLLRMTKARFGSLRRKATLVDSGENWSTWSHRWTPSAKERKTHPEFADDAAVDVYLHEITVTPKLTLLLCTTGSDTAEEAAELYKKRYDDEVDIRNIKVVLDTENIRARSVSMFHKELFMSMVGYNLVVQFRRQAAQCIKESPRRLSFKRVWTTFRTFLLSQTFTEPAEWRAAYDRALKYATQDKLPNRPGQSYPRAAYQRRPKSQQYEKREDRRKKPK